MGHSQWLWASFPLTHGVAQGSILGPVLFCLYMPPLENTTRKYNIYCHFYTNDSQLYLQLKSRDYLKPLLDCFKDIKGRIANYFIQFTEVIIVCPSTSNKPPHQYARPGGPHMWSHMQKRRGCYLWFWAVFKNKWVMLSYYELLSIKNHSQT